MPPVSSLVCYLFHHNPDVASIVPQGTIATDLSWTISILFAVHHSPRPISCRRCYLRQQSTRISSSSPINRTENTFIHPFPMHWQLPLQIIYWAALFSVIVLVFHGLLVKFNCIGFGLKTDEPQHGNTTTFIAHSKPHRVFAALRFLGCLAIFALSIVEILVSRPSSAVDRQSKDLILCLVFVRPILSILFVYSC